MKHEPHEHGGHRWAFDTPENTAVFVCEHVFSSESPVLSVYHEVDGDWQLLCDADHSESAPKLVCLGCTVAKDPSLMGLSDLPLGFVAWRGTTDQAWSREAQAGE